LDAKPKKTFKNLKLKHLKNLGFSIPVCRCLDIPTSAYWHS